VLVRWDAEADVDGPRGPGDGVPDDELLDTVLPDDPGRDPDRFRRRGHAGLGELLRRQGARMPRFASRHLSHLDDGIEHTFDPVPIPFPKTAPTVSAARVTTAAMTFGPPVYRFDVTGATYQCRLPRPTR
jgi:hypothetical protein